MNRIRRVRLLPEDGPLGWTPYAWLLYMASFLIEPVTRLQQGRASALYLTAMTAGVLIFLVLYFRGYWVRGRQLLPIIAAITALGIAFTPFNVGAGVLYAYAGGFAGNLGDRPRYAARLIVLIALIGGVMGALVRPPLFYWVVAVVITLLVGFVNLHFAQVSAAGRRLRLAHREIEQLAAVAERERIARDMHDVLGHTLSLIVLKAELAARLAERDPARAAAEMHDVEDVARRTLQDVREAIRGYRATLGEEADRAATLLKTAGITASVDIASDRLDARVEETIGFALREAVTNVVRHSGAERCTIRVTCDAGTITLAVDDDGRGYRGPEGSGLRGMRERVAVFGGSVDMVSGEGMRLRVTLPAQPAAARLDPAAVMRSTGVEQPEPATQ